jgi:hypothetical protein
VLGQRRHIVLGPLDAGAPDRGHGPPACLPTGESRLPPPSRAQSPGSLCGRAHFRATNP